MYSLRTISTTVGMFIELCFDYVAVRIQLVLGTICMPEAMMSVQDMPLPTGWTLSLLEQRMLKCSRLLERLPFNMTCLYKALVVRRYFTRRGIQVVLKIGALGTMTVPSVHAWVEVQGASFLKGDFEGVTLTKVSLE
jgi:hypothetical protein